MILILTLLLLLSFALNIFLSHRLKIKKTSKELSPDARQLLHDLTRGAGLVRIIPLDPEGLLYHSPRKIT
jgi:hypothetical protein